MLCLFLNIDGLFIYKVNRNDIDILVCDNANRKIEFQKFKQVFEFVDVLKFQSCFKLVNCLKKLENGQITKEFLDVLQLSIKNKDGFDEFEFFTLNKSLNDFLVVNYYNVVDNESIYSFLQENTKNVDALIEENLKSLQNSNHAEVNVDLEDNSFEYAIEDVTSLELESLFKVNSEYNYSGEIIVLALERLLNFNYICDITQNYPTVSLVSDKRTNEIKFKETNGILTLNENLNELYKIEWGSKTNTISICASIGGPSIGVPFENNNFGNFKLALKQIIQWNKLKNKNAQIKDHLFLIPFYSEFNVWTLVITEIRFNCSKIECIKINTVSTLNEYRPKIDFGKVIQEAYGEAVLINEHQTVRINKDDSLDCNSDGVIITDFSFQVLSRASSIDEFNNEPPAIDEYYTKDKINYLRKTHLNKIDRPEYTQEQHGKCLHRQSDAYKHIYAKYFKTTEGKQVLNELETIQDTLNILNTTQFIDLLAIEKILCRYAIRKCSNTSLNLFDSFWNCIVKHLTSIYHYTDNYESNDFDYLNEIKYKLELDFNTLDLFQLIRKCICEIANEFKVVFNIDYYDFIDLHDVNKINFTIFDQNNNKNNTYPEIPIVIYAFTTGFYTFSSIERTFKSAVDYFDYLFYEFCSDITAIDLYFYNEIKNIDDDVLQSQIENIYKQIEDANGLTEIFNSIFLNITNFQLKFVFAQMAYIEKYITDTSLDSIKDFLIGSLKKSVDKTVEERTEKANKEIELLKEKEIETLKQMNCLLEKVEELDENDRDIRKKIDNLNEEIRRKSRDRSSKIEDLNKLKTSLNVLEVKMKQNQLDLLKSQYKFTWSTFQNEICKYFDDFKMIQARNNFKAATNLDTLYGKLHGICKINENELKASLSVLDNSQKVEIFNGFNGLLKTVLREPTVKLNNVNRNIVEIKGGYVILSDVLRNLRTFSNIVNEVHFIAANTLFIDDDMNDYDLWGAKNIVIIAKRVEIVSTNERVLTLNTSGASAKRNYTNASASDGTHSGESGSHGVDGDAGQSAGNVYINAENVKNSRLFKIIANGGNGCDGQNGGNGNKGSDGNNGSDGVAGSKPSFWRKGAYLNSGTSGSSGCSGGHGGRAGRGGDGGFGGCVSLKNGALVINQIEAKKGQLGKDGRPGSGGDGGFCGRDGIDEGWSCPGEFDSWKKKRGKLEIVYEEGFMFDTAYLRVLKTEQQCRNTTRRQSQNGRRGDSAYRQKNQNRATASRKISENQLNLVASSIINKNPQTATTLSAGNVERNEIQVTIERDARERAGLNAQSMRVNSEIEQMNANTRQIQNQIGNFQQNIDSNQNQRNSHEANLQQHDNILNEIAAKTNQLKLKQELLLNLNKIFEKQHKQKYVNQEQIFRIGTFNEKQKDFYKIEFKLNWSDETHSFEYSSSHEANGLDLSIQNLLDLINSADARRLNLMCFDLAVYLKVNYKIDEVEAYGVVELFEAYLFYLMGRNESRRTVYLECLNSIFLCKIKEKRYNLKKDLGFIRNGLSGLIYHEILQTNPTFTQYTGDTVHAKTLKFQIEKCTLYRHRLFESYLIDNDKNSMYPLELAMCVFNQQSNESNLIEVLEAFQFEIIKFYQNGLNYFKIINGNAANLLKTCLKNVQHFKLDCNYTIKMYNWSKTFYCYFKRVPHASFYFANEFKQLYDLIHSNYMTVYEIKIAYLRDLPWLNDKQVNCLLNYVFKYDNRLISAGIERILSFKDDIDVELISLKDKISESNAKSNEKPKEKIPQNLENLFDIIESQRVHYGEEFGEKTCQTIDLVLMKLRKIGFENDIEKFLKNIIESLIEFHLNPIKYSNEDYKCYLIESILNDFEIDVLCKKHELTNELRLLLNEFNLNELNEDLFYNFRNIQIKYEKLQKLFGILKSFKIEIKDFQVNEVEYQILNYISYTLNMEVIFGFALSTFQIFEKRIKNDDDDDKRRFMFNFYELFKNLSEKFTNSIEKNELFAKLDLNLFQFNQDCFNILIGFNLNEITCIKVYREYLLRLVKFKSLQNKNAVEALTVNLANFNETNMDSFKLLLNEFDLNLEEIDGLKEVCLRHEELHDCLVEIYIGKYEVPLQKDIENGLQKLVKYKILTYTEKMIVKNKLSQFNDVFKVDLYNFSFQDQYIFLKDVNNLIKSSEAFGDEDENSNKFKITRFLLEPFTWTFSHEESQRELNFEQLLRHTLRRIVKFPNILNVAISQSIQNFNSNMTEVNFINLATRFIEYFDEFYKNDDVNYECDCLFEKINFILKSFEFGLTLLDKLLNTIQSKVITLSRNIKSNQTQLNWLHAIKDLCRNSYIKYLCGRSNEFLRESNESSKHIDKMKNDILVYFDRIVKKSQNIISIDGALNKIKLNIERIDFQNSNNEEKLKFFTSIKNDFCVDGVYGDDNTNEQNETNYAKRTKMNRDETTAKEILLYFERSLCYEGNLLNTQLSLFDDKSMEDTVKDLIKHLSVHLIDASIESFGTDFVPDKVIEDKIERLNSIFLYYLTPSDFESTIKNDLSIFSRKYEHFLEQNSNLSSKSNYLNLYFNVKSALADETSYYLRLFSEKKEKHLSDLNQKSELFRNYFNNSIDFIFDCTFCFKTPQIDYSISTYVTKFENEFRHNCTSKQEINEVEKQLNQNKQALEDEFQDKFQLKYVVSFSTELTQLPFKNNSNAIKILEIFKDNLKIVAFSRRISHEDVENFFYYYLINLNLIKDNLTLNDFGKLIRIFNEIVRITFRPNNNDNLLGLFEFLFSQYNCELQKLFEDSDSNETLTDYVQNNCEYKGFLNLSTKIDRIIEKLKSKDSQMITKEVVLFKFEIYAQIIDIVDVQINELIQIPVILNEIIRTETNRILKLDNTSLVSYLESKLKQNFDSENVNECLFALENYQFYTYELLERLLDRITTLQTEELKNFANSFIQFSLKNAAIDESHRKSTNTLISVIIQKSNDPQSIEIFKYFLLNDEKYYFDFALNLLIADAKSHESLFQIFTQTASVTEWLDELKEYLTKIINQKFLNLSDTAITQFLSSLQLANSTNHINETDKIIKDKFIKKLNNFLNDTNVSETFIEEFEYFVDHFGHILTLSNINVDNKKLIKDVNEISRFKYAFSKSKYFLELNASSFVWFQMMNALLNGLIDDTNQSNQDNRILFKLNELCEIFEILIESTENYDEIMQFNILINFTSIKDWIKNLLKIRLEKSLNSYLNLFDTNTSVKLKYFNNIMNYLEENLKHKPTLSRILISKLDIEVKLCNDKNILLNLNDFERIIRKIFDLNEELNDFDLKQLDKTPLFEWLNKLNEIKLFKLLPNTELVDEKNKTVYLLLELKLKTDENVFQAFIDILLQAPLKYTKLNCILLKILNSNWIIDNVLLGHLKNDLHNFDEIWLNIIENYNNSIFSQNGEIHSLASLIRIMKNDSINKHLINIPNETLEKIESSLVELKKYLGLQRLSSILTTTNKYISQWSENEIKDWANVIKNSQSAKDLVYGNIIEVLAVLCQAVRLCTGTEGFNNGYYPRDAQLIVLLLFIEATIKNKSRIGQVATGEGKTIIVACFAIIKSLCVQYVHVITSSTVLAIRDSNEKHKLFKLFNINVTNNCDSECDKDLDVRRERYSSDVVYGDVASFQRDILLTRFFGKDITKNREPDCLIVDEVDNMLLDKAEHTLYLSHRMIDLRHLRFMFIEIWHATHAADVSTGTDKDIKLVVDFIRKRLRAKDIVIPAYLENFVNYRLEVWIKNAFLARNMTEKDPYILACVDKMNKSPQIVIMDKDTGVEQIQMQWSNGLHQFLQLKHKQKLTEESLKAVFMSNLSYFKQYSDKIYGITGTLGSKIEQDLLSQVYQVDFFSVPRFKIHKFYEDDARIGSNEHEWLSLIVQAINEKVNKNRAVLIISENIANVEKIYNNYYTNSTSKSSIYKYTSTFECFKKGTEINPLQPGDIILATNLAGRGTDLLISPDLNQNGGLHVILSYLPTNLRVEEQAFGRSARKGENGSGEFVILNSRTSIEDECDGFKTIEDLKTERNKMETIRLEEIRTHSLKCIEIEKKLFDRFTAFYGNTKTKLEDYYRQKNCERTNDQSMFTDIRELADDLMQNRIDERLLDAENTYLTVQLDCLKNRWALWLDEMSETVNMVNVIGERTILKKFDEFKVKIEQVLLDDMVLCLVNSPTELIRLGAYYERIEDYECAKKCFEKVISTDTEFSEIAHYYMSVCLFKESDSGLKVKREAVGHFKQAYKLMKNNISTIMTHSNALNMIYTKDSELNGTANNKNFLDEQFQNEIKLYSVHVNAIEDITGRIFTSDLFKNLNGVADSEEKDEKNASELCENLMKNREIIKNYRLSKKVYIEKYFNNAENQFQDGLFIKTTTKNAGKRQIEIPSIFNYCKYDILTKLKGKMGSLVQRELLETYFEDTIMTRQKFWNVLSDNGLLNDVKTENKFIISIDETVANSGESVLDRLNLQNLFKNEQAIKKILQSNNKNIFNPKTIFPFAIEADICRQVNVKFGLKPDTQLTNTYFVYKSSDNSSWNLSYIDSLNNIANETVFKELNEKLECIEGNLSNDLMFEVNEIIKVYHVDKVYKLLEDILIKANVIVNCATKSACIKLNRFRVRFLNRNLTEDDKKYCNTYFIIKQESNRQIDAPVLYSFKIIYVDNNFKENLINLNKQEKIKEFLLKNNNDHNNNNNGNDEELNVCLFNEHFKKVVLRNPEIYGYCQLSLKRSLIKYSTIITALVSDINETIDDVSHNLEKTFYLDDIPLLTTPLEASRQLWLYLKDNGVIKDCCIKFSIEDSLDKTIIENKIERIRQTLIEYFMRKEKLEVASYDTAVYMAKQHKSDKNIKLVEIDKYINNIMAIMKTTIGKMKTVPKIEINYEKLENFFMTGDYPPEIELFKDLIFERVILLNEKKSFWDWNAFACAMIGVAQVVCGILIKVYFPGPIGNYFGDVLISEGIGDIMFAIEAGLNKNFTWSNYCKHKIVSVFMSLVSVGIGSYLCGGIGNKFVGLTGMKLFKAAVGTILTKLATATFNALANYGIEKALDLLRRTIIDTFADSFKSLIELDPRVKTQVTILEQNIEKLFLLKNSRDASKIIERSFENIVRESQEGTLGKQLLNVSLNLTRQILGEAGKAAGRLDELANEQFDQAASQMESGISQNAANLTASSANLAAKAATIIKVVKYIRRLNTLFQTGKEIHEIVQLSSGIYVKLNEELEKVIGKSSQTNMRRVEDMSEVERKALDDFKASFISSTKLKLSDMVCSKIQHSFIQPHLQRMVHKLMATLGNKLLSSAQDAFTFLRDDKYEARQAAKEASRRQAQNQKNNSDGYLDINGLDPNTQVHNANGLPISKLKTIYGSSLKAYKDKDGNVHVQRPTFKEFLKSMSEGRPSGILAIFICAAVTDTPIKVYGLKENNLSLEDSVVFDARNEKKRRQHVKDPFEIYYNNNHFSPMVNGEVIDLAQNEGMIKDSCLFQTMMFLKNLKTSGNIDQARQQAESPEHVKNEIETISKQAYNSNRIRFLYSRNLNEFAADFSGGTGGPHWYNAHFCPACDDGILSKENHPNLKCKNDKRMKFIIKAIRNILDKNENKGKIKKINSTGTLVTEDAKTAGQTPVPSGVNGMIGACIVKDNNGKEYISYGLSSYFYTFNVIDMINKELKSEVKRIIENEYNPRRAAKLWKLFNDTKKVEFVKNSSKLLETHLNIKGNFINYRNEIISGFDKKIVHEGKTYAFDPKRFCAYTSMFYALAQADIFKNSSISERLTITEEPYKDFNSFEVGFPAKSCNNCRFFTKGALTHIPKRQISTNFNANNLESISDRLKNTRL